MALKPFGKMEEYTGSVPWAIFPRKRLDITYADIVSGISSCFYLRDSQRASLTNNVEMLWDPSGHGLVCLSVRTGFDLFLQTMNYPKGSEIICSSITIPDMIKVLHHHGLVAVPIDLDDKTLAMQTETLAAAVTDKTKAILVAHIFGTLTNLDPVVEFADAHKLLVIEDCAQAYCGPSYKGHPKADVSMFSFGTIKTSTAFGGAMFRVLNNDILDGMKRRNNRYEPRSRMFFLQRLVKYSALHGMTSPPLFGLFLKACRQLGYNHDEVITSQIRGFSGGDLITLLRQRPSMPLLGLLHRKLSTYDHAYVLERKAKSELLERLIKDVPQASVPGNLARNHYYWLFPVVCPEPKRVAALMIQDGFDVTSGATQLAFVPHPTNAAFDPVNAKAIMQNLVYLPVTAEMPNWAVEKMAKSFAKAVGAVSRAKL
ncbi:hypothetical protein SDRG_03269 [Saprolegnia diclina VS20]|uniref:DegT/DnrJ/EryC1/StrS aminotransferase n=1 Tax=Saprolegnia diclina (strain VS20) TaxID=1156394 RepID=T0QWL7_SAPDV|nr:hypothetical protein SDRG_03269 [Saprolegnia diclina VS20]EQC39061.1 hypothetical protein SDRG_03269 [Saprolegnia diclina VS20]|eukprot:XP_008607122.1 hypothetical protein SDRG_03269 [Saprolegnia diclina VS20]